jgi:hypothetical protein
MHPEREAPMTLRQWFAASPQAARWCKALGVAVFAVAFFLPACRYFGTRSEIVNLGTYKGWQCAQVSLMLTVAPETYRSPLLLAVFGGLINPIVVLYLACYRPRFAHMRRVLGWAILFCLISTWAFFAVDQFIPLIGHFMWIAGIGLILAANRSSPSDRSTAEPGS